MASLRPNLGTVRPCSWGIAPRRSHTKALPTVARAVAAPEREAQAATSSSDYDETYDGPSALAAHAAAQAQASPSGRRVVLESDDELKSTWEQRAWVGAATLFMAGTMANGLAHVEDAGGALAAAAALGAAYVLSDLGTGIYHWGVDK
jgi:ubiquitin-conjugating enzyme E2 variant